jgi:hypothetical protein
MALSSDELKAMAEHVQYEMAEFRKAIARLQRLTESDAQWNGTIESALLHFRILRTFLLGETQRSDDVTASDFVPGWNPQPDSVFEVTKADIDKRLAHLTTRRLKELSWPLNEMNMAVERLIANFASRLSVCQRSWFPHLLDTPPVITLSANINYSTHSQSAYRVLIDSDFPK